MFIFIMHAPHVQNWAGAPYDTKVMYHEVMLWQEQEIEAPLA